MQRVVAIDLARFIAIVGMMAAHLLVSIGTYDWLDPATSGFPSTLFAVLGGFGVVFASRKYLRAGRTGAAIVAVCARGLVVVAIGLIMEVFPDHLIAVILVYYGFAIMVGSLLVIIPTIPLTILTIVGSIATPLMIFAVVDMTQDSVSSGMLDYASVPTFILSVLFTGTYPALTWSVYLAIGIIVARQILEPRSLRDQRITAVVVSLCGAAAWLGAEIATTLRINAIAPNLARVNDMTEAEVALALRFSQYGSPFNGGWDAILLGSPHSGTTADILRTAGASVLLISILVLIFSKATGPGKILAPFTRVGASPLTVYVLHIAMTAYSLWIYALVNGPSHWRDAVGGSPLMAASFWWQLAIIMALGVFWAFTGRRGPLERLTTYLSASAVKLSGLGLPPSQAPDTETPRPQEGHHTGT